jgi:hypothetical protein
MSNRHSSESRNDWYDCFGHDVRSLALYFFIGMAVAILCNKIRWWLF